MLLGNRNQIAHVQYDLVGFQEYQDLHTEILWLMQDFHDQIERAAFSRAYLRNPATDHGDEQPSQAVAVSPRPATMPAAYRMLGRNRLHFSYERADHKQRSGGMSDERKLQLEDFITSREEDLRKMNGLLSQASDQGTKDVVSQNIKELQADIHMASEELSRL